MSGHIPIHLERLGLVRNPFPQTPDAACYFHTDYLERELGEAVHCLMARKGFVLLTGEVGTGKTTFVRKMLDSLLAEDTKVSLVLNSFLQGRELLQAVLQDFGLSGNEDFASNIQILNEFLIAQYHTGTLTTLVIDDAQNLSLESLELLRLLSNLETGQEKLIQIVLVGQPELITSLSKPEIRQLKSRIVKHIQLGSMSVADLRAYVNFRLVSAGAEGRIRITGLALKLLHRCAKGNPRRVHMIMDRCLYGVLAIQGRQIGALLVWQAARESGMQEMLAERKWPTKVVATLLAVAGVVSLGIYTYRDQAPLPLASAKKSIAASKLADNAPLQATPTVAPVSKKLTVPVANATRTDSVQKAWTQCLGQHRMHRGSTIDSADSLAKDVVLFSVSPQVAHVLANARLICKKAEHDVVTIAWRPTVRPEDFASGAVNENVRFVQQVLAHEGVFAVEPTGVFGPKTKESIRLFQEKYSLPVTGKPDPITLVLIEEQAVQIKANPVVGEQ